MSTGDYGSVSSSAATTESGTSSEGSSLAIELGATIRQNLQSQRTADKIVGLKTLLAVMSKGEHVAEFYPLVVQEITSDDETLRHLAYVYLVHYAEADPDSALMSVNTFQRSLTDSDPIVRALALKILSSIRSREIIEIVLDAVQSCITDMSPYVRKAAALALVKIYETDSECQSSLIPLLSRLLQDQSIIAISGGLYALQRIMPDNDKMLHPVFRTLCRVLPRLDPWGQATALHLLQRYARRNFKEPTAENDWFTEEESEQETDPDLELLIKSAQPLLNSITPCVSLAAASLFFYCAPSYKLQLIAKPLIRLTYGDPGTAYAALMAIASFSADNAEPFVPHVKHFFLCYDDPLSIKKLKLLVLSQLARPSNSEILLRELAQYVHDSDKELASAAVTAMGRTASASGDASSSCINLLVKLLKSPCDSVLCQAVQMLCLLLRTLPSTKSIEEEDEEELAPTGAMDETEVTSVLINLLSIFGKINDPETKAALVSLIGDKVRLIPLQAHEVLRQLAVTFPHQDVAVKMQTVNLAAKLLVNKKGSVADLARYVFSLGFYDCDIDLRDRSRLLHSLLTAPTESGYLLKLRGKAEQFLFPTRGPVVWEGDICKASYIEVGSFSSIFGKLISKSSLTVKWCDPSKVSRSSVRDEATYEDETSPGQEEDDLESFFGPSSSRKAVITAPVTQKALETGSDSDQGEEEEDMANYFEK